MKWTYLFYLVRPMNFYGCKSVINLLTTSVPYTGVNLLTTSGTGDGGGALLYCVYVHIY